MAARPAKQQKRPAAHYSSDDDFLLADDGSASANGVSTRSAKRRTTRAGLAQASPPKDASPRSKRTKTKVTPSRNSTVSPEKPKEARNGSIYTFFTTTAQKQQLSTEKARPEPKAPDEEDQIQDDSDDGGRPGVPLSGRAAHEKATVANGTATSSHAPTSNTLPKASQKFVNISKRAADTGSPTASASPVLEELDRRPWAEKFAPTSLDELAVHNRKVADVRAWFDSVFAGRSGKRLLVLKGAAGTGKTTTISLLSKTMGFDILEWRNPTGSAYATEGYSSASAQFEDFIGRSSRFGGLDVHGGDETAGGPQVSSSTASSSSSRKKVILIEEFPNTFTSSSGSLQSFRNTLRNHIAASVAAFKSIFPGASHRPDFLPPVALIVSETLLTTASASADSFTAHRLLGPEVLSHPGATVIEFNPIARTLLAKALSTVLRKESRKSGRRTAPGPLVLERLGEVGDVRSAVGSLEFLCLRGDADADWGAKVAFGKTKRSANDAVPLTKMERESLELVTQREASLGIFHAVGKVVYNKREEIPSSEPPLDAVEPIPDHLLAHSRSKTSQVRIDELIDETGTDTQTFLAALHENYVLSCHQSSTDGFLDSANGCIDALSDSDLLCTSKSGSSGRGSTAGGSGQYTSGTENLRREEMSFQVAVRGLLFSLPHPVKRPPPPASVQGSSRRTTNGKGDAFKMFYPMSLKLWRQTEEVEAIVDVWVRRSMEGGPLKSWAGPLSSPRTKSGTVESWKSNFRSSAENPSLGQGPASSTEPEPTLARGGNSARQETLLERMPYLTRIERVKLQPSAARRELEKVTVFEGIEGQANDWPEDEGEERDGSQATDWATDRPTETTSSPQAQRRRRRQGQGEKGQGDSGSWFLGEKDIEKLVLSEDDIEDD